MIITICQGNGSENATNELPLSLTLHFLIRQDMKDRLATPKSVSDAVRNAEGRDVDAERAARRERRRERASRRKTLESTNTGGDQPTDTVNITDADLLQKPRDSEPNISRTKSNLARTNSVSSTEGFLGGDTSLRVVSPPPSVISDMDSTTTTHTPGNSPLPLNLNPVVVPPQQGNLV